jgi:hypothetical protein
MSSHRTEEEVGRLSMQKTKQIHTACGRGEEGENKAVARRLGIGGSNRLKLERVITGVLKCISELPSPFYQFGLLVALASA